MKFGSAISILLWTASFAGSLARPTELGARGLTDGLKNLLGPKAPSKHDPLPIDYIFTVFPPFRDDRETYFNDVSAAALGNFRALWQVEPDLASVLKTVQKYKAQKRANRRAVEDFIEGAENLIQIKMQVINMVKLRVAMGYPAKFDKKKRVDQQLPSAPTLPTTFSDAKTWKKDKVSDLKKSQRTAKEAIEGLASNAVNLIALWKTWPANETPLPALPDYLTSFGDKDTTQDGGWKSCDILMYNYFQVTLNTINSR